MKDSRVSVDDMEWLVKFWRSELAERRSEQGKKNRQCQKVLHTTGSKSHARVTTELAQEKGYAPRRDEVFVKTHKKKDGTVLNAETEKVLKDIDTAIEEHPELLEKSIAVELEKRKKDELLQRMEDEVLHKRKEDELLQMKEDELVKKRKEDELVKKRKEDELLQKKKAEDLMNKKKEQGLQKKRENEAQRKETIATQKNNMKGKDVILYNFYRDHGTPVAKATILSTDRKKIVGGHELGNECCEIVVNYIIKRDAIVPRPIGNVTNIGQAQGRAIAWPYKHLEMDTPKKTEASPPQAGISPRRSARVATSRQ